MRLAFDAAWIAAALRDFSPKLLDRMEVVIDTSIRRVVLEIAGLEEARAFLADDGLVEGRDYRAGDAIELAGLAILQLEEERED